MIAASAADVDGLGIVLGQRVYQEYHHVLGHNVSFALLLGGALTVYSTHRLKAFCIYLGLAHLHLVLDYFGSGPLWRIYYLWPLSRWSVVFEHAWEFYSWQNISTAAAFLAWTLAIAVRRGRTPLEAVMPSLDMQLVDWLRRRVRPPRKS
jgi:hypothetical protein